MPLERDSRRIVIAGASSLLGAELKSLLEESRFAASDFRLLDEELAAGILTEAGGEAAVIQPVEEDSFDRARFVFFAGSPDFTLANLELARRSGDGDYRSLRSLCIVGRLFPVVSRTRETARSRRSGKPATRNHSVRSG